MLMHAWGGKCIASPSDTTAAGRSSWPRTPTVRGAWPSPSAKLWRKRFPTRPAPPSTPGLGAQPRHAPPDHHRPGDQAPAGEGRRADSRRGHRLRRRRI
jgi:hypothetical protein